MKLFGTIVYPKNRYLTLQFSRGGKNVMCEDYFDNMVGLFTVHGYFCLSPRHELGESRLIIGELSQRTSLFILTILLLSQFHVG